jgi:hypothetical protein
MNAAAIGLIGVIVGGLLAGAVNWYFDHRRRLAKARVAARLIGVELQAAEDKVASAVGAASWWIGDLPREAWRKYQSRLATDVSPDVLAAVAGAYDLCASLNDEHAAARTSKAGPQGNLESYAMALSVARNRLADDGIRQPV